MAPKISVVMSTHNDAPYLGAAIDSILEQTYPDFEFIIINDASSDETATILQGFDDPRLRIIHNETNLGLARSLNRGLELAQGDFIARMDADDIATPSARFADQLAFLADHPQIGMLSGDMVSISAQGEPLVDTSFYEGQAASHAILAWKFLWACPISHITVMMRQDLLKTHNLGYDPAMNNAEDYDLWTRLARHTQLYRSEQVWAYRRVLDTSISHRYLENQLRLVQQIMSREQAHLLGHPPAPSTLDTLFQLIYSPGLSPTATPKAAQAILRYYQAWTQHHTPTPAEREAVQAEAVQFLMRLIGRAPTLTHQLNALRVLWKLSKRDIVTRKMAKKLKQAPFLKGDNYYTQFFLI